MKRLLIVDDDPEMREILKLALENRFEVATAANGLEALHCVEAASFDAILLDLNMPVLDGVGFVRELRRRRIVVPIVICSGEIDIAQTAAALDVHDYLRKPVGLEQLDETLSRMTAAARRRRRCSGLREAEA